MEANTPWWKFFPRELRIYHAVTPSMKRREPTLMYVFTLPNYPNERIKLYGPDISYEGKKRGTKERLSKKAIRDRDRLTRNEIIHGKQSVLKEYFPAKTTKQSIRQKKK